MKRRDLLTLISSATAAWPLGASAQISELKRVGWLVAFPKNSPLAQDILAAFGQTLRGFGWLDGQNIELNYRFAASDPALFKTYAAQLVALSPDVIVATTTPAAAALRELTRTIPIIFVVVPDPIGMGFVRSFARPGANMTGFVSYDPPIIGKWIQLLKEIAPSTTRVAAIFNPNTGFPPSYFAREIEAASSFGVRAILAPVKDSADLEQVIATQARKGGGGLIILPDSFNVRNRDVIVAAAIRHKVPLIGFDVFAKAGGLMTYWFDTAELHAQAASYVDRILKGEKASDLPVQAPTRYVLTINLKTARAIGLDVSPTLLARADEVIE
jgi:putative ABC transport system substrate-binding protein